MANEEIVNYFSRIIEDQVEHDQFLARLCVATGSDLGSFEELSLISAVTSFSFAFRNEDPRIAKHPSDNVISGVTEYAAIHNDVVYIVRRELPKVFKVLTMTNQQNEIIHSTWHPLSKEPN